MNAQPQKQQNQPQQPAAPDTGRLNSTLGEISFPEFSTVSPGCTVSIDAAAAITAVSTRLAEKKEIEKLVNSLWEVSKTGRPASVQKDLVAAADLIVDRIVAHAGDITVDLATFPTDIRIDAASGRMLQSVGDSLRNLFKGADPKLADALLLLSGEQIASDPKAKTQPALEEGLSERISNAVVNPNAGAPALPFTLVRQEYQIAGGAISIVFGNDKSGNQTVEVVNNNSGIKATFTAEDLNAAEAARFSELQLRMGRDSTESLPAQSTLRGAGKIPKLTEVTEVNQLKTIYRLLSDYSNAGKLAFDPSGQSPKDLVMRPLKALASAIPDLGLTTSVTTLPIKGSDALRSERAAATSGKFNPEEHALQLQHASGTESIAFKALKAAPVNAISEIIVRQELDHYIVDVKMRGRNGEPATVAILAEVDSQGPRASELANRLSGILEQFSREDSLDPSKSEALKSLLQLGPIQSIKGEGPKGRPAEISGVNWLGHFMAPGAEISRVTFSNSSLDFCGKGITFKECKFENCAIGFNARDVELKQVDFDSKCVFYGKLSGDFKESKMRGNAYHLDILELKLLDIVSLTKSVTEKNMKLRELFSGLVLNRDFVPLDLGKVTAAHTGKDLGKENERISALFNADVLIARLCANEPGHLNQPGFTRFRSYLGGQQYLDYADRDHPSDLSNFVTERFLYSDKKAGVIDFFPPYYDKKVPGDSPKLRIYVDDDLKMRYAFSTTEDLPDTYEEAEELSKKFASQVKVDEGNIETWKAVLSFQHIDFSLYDENLKSPGSAVYVPGLRSWPVP